MIKFIKKVLKKNKLITRIYVKITYKISSNKIKRYGSQLLNDLYCALKPTNHLFFLDYGALLGFVREGTFLSHDPDIDISIIYKDEKTYKNIEHALIKAGFRKKFCKFKKDKIILEGYVKYGTKIDVFYYYNKGNKSYAYSTYEFKDRNYKEPYDRSILKYEYSLINETIKNKWGDCEFPIPKNYIQTLTEKYGEKWSIPIKTWGIDNYKETVHEITDDGIYVNLF